MEEAERDSREGVAVPDDEAVVRVRDRGSRDERAIQRH
jgi:hypothetical protein